MEGGAGWSSEGDSTRYLGDREGLYADSKEKENHLTLIVWGLKRRDTESLLALLLAHAQVGQGGMAPG